MSLPLLLNFFENGPYAYNVMFNFGTGMENVTHLKNRTIFLYGVFNGGPASEPLAHH